MSEVLETAKAHFASQEKRYIDVPEWGSESEPLRIFWTPITMQDRRNVYRRDEKGLPPDGGQIYVRAIILKAQDKSGKKMFGGVTDEADLMHRVDPAIVDRIGMAILGLDDAGQDTMDVDAAKN